MVANSKRSTRSAADTLFTFGQTGPEGDNNWLKD